MKAIIGCLVFILSFGIGHAFCQDTVHFTSPGQNLAIGKHIATLEDKEKNLSATEALAIKRFKTSRLDAPNLEVSLSDFWVKMIIHNASDAPNLVINLEYPTIDSITFYSLTPAGTFDSVVSGEFLPIYARQYRHQNYIFKLKLPPGKTEVYLMKVSASEPIQLPLSIGTSQSISEEIDTRDLLFGLYAGIILVMLLYNLFLYFTVRDISYLFYVGYILFTGLTQACLQGYSARFFYPSSYFLANAMTVWVPAFSGIFAILFINNFLQTKKYTPLLYRALMAFMAIYVAILLFSFTGQYLVCTEIMQLAVTLLAIVVYITAVKISIKGYRPAKIFLVAWSVFIAAVVVFVLRNFGVLPYNNFTYYAMQIGSAVEVVVLSVALADKINLFRKEKEESQMQAMVALRENERIVTEQNVMLEKKVEERTQELKLSNSELNKAMRELKDAESQLVESEKMASLGQLTAGIAHEINNPINFVTSNVKPLNRDVLILLDAVDNMEQMLLQNMPEKRQEILALKEQIDYDYLKEEIDQLLSGISDGAKRTAEIVKGLRIFSRLDEDDLKRANVNEGMDSTLIITNNLLENKIIIEKRYGNLPLIECYPGKLNQVFLNMISNAIYAVKKKFKEENGGLITITTALEGGVVNITIADNGIGMDENTKKRLFEPFFTTKDVGEGTGLGLSIAYNTIHKHNGQILLESEPGIGTSFKIQLPLIQQ